MKKQRKSLWIVLCGVVAAFGVMLGVWSGTPVQVDAAATAPTLTMDVGASVRKTPGDPGIKFKATIGNWDHTYQYGMMILPAQAWDTFSWWGKDVDYVNELLGKGLVAGEDFIQSECPAYLDADDSVKIALAMTDINTENYTEEFVGVAYAEKDGQYIYSPVNEFDNARSITYVAQKALQYEADKLSASQEQSMIQYANPDMLIDKDAYFTDDTMDFVGETNVVLADYAMKYVFNASGETVSQITKEAYPGGSTVSFKYYIPAGTKTSWWGIAWHTDPTKIDMYHAAGINEAVGYKALGAVLGTWKQESFTLPEGGPYYLYFGSEVGGSAGRWMVNGENSYALIDNFTINDEVETFGAKLQSSIFTVLAAPGATTQQLSPGSIYFSEASLKGEYSAKIIVDRLSSAYHTTASFITKDKYPAGSTVSFKYYVPSDVTSSWFAVCGVTNPDDTELYANWLWQGNLEEGSWQTLSVTLTQESYIHFAGAVGDWGGKDSPKTEGYVLIDNFVVKYGNTVVSETFNEGVDKSLFNVNTPGAVEEGEGYEETTLADGEYAMKYIFNASSETVSQVTKKAYAGGSTVSFRYYIPAGTKVGNWWGLAYKTTNTDLDIYDAANGDRFQISKTVGEWVNVSYTLPEGGPYYLYFGSAVNEWTWSEGGNPYVLIDDFTVGDEVEDFDKAEEDWAFDILVPGTVVLSEKGDGFVPVPQGVKIMLNTISGTASTPSFITRKAYSGVATVTFDCFITGNPNGKWWAFSWTSDKKNANIYALNNNGNCTPTNNGRGLTTDGQDAWQTITVEIPEGEWYFYIAGEKGAWGEGYVILDNIVFKDANGNVIESEDFENGYTVFENNRETSIFLVKGKVEGEEEGGEVEGGEETENTQKPSDVTSLAYLLQKGTIVEYMDNSGYASIATLSNVSINKEELPASSLLLEGTLGYKITGNKEFAIYFGNGGFLYISESKIALYNGTTLVKELTYTTAADATLNLSITAGGKVLVKWADAYVGLGKLTGDVTMAKLIALGGDGKAEICTIAIDTYYVTLNNAPIYFSEEGIDFTAYAFDSDSMVSEEGFQLLSDAGFTKTLALLQGRLTDGTDRHEKDIPDRAHVEKLMAEVNKDAMAALALAEKYGLKHYVLNSNLYNLERNKNNYQWVDDFAELATYTLSEAFAGHFLADEPEHTMASWTQTELEELVNAYKAYKQAYPNGEAFINLLPITNTTADSTYKTYVQYYIENIALDKNGVPGTGYVSFDHYPLLDSGVSSKHLRNLEIVGEMCRDDGIELRTYIKASTTGDTERDIRATESVNDLYMQIYSALAYGSKEIIYYQFTDHTKTDGTAGDGVISGSTLEKGNVYNWTKQANNEVKSLGAAYMNFTWKSASVFGSTGITQFSKLNSKASAYGYLTGVSSSASVLVGNFDDNDGVYDYSAKHGYMVVNYGNTDNITHATSGITLTFNGEVDKVLVYENGKPTVYTLSGNAVTLQLEMGEGAFVIPFKA